MDYFAIGRVTQLKDLETFIEAIAILNKEFPNVVGLIVGGVRKDKQNYFASLQNLVNSLHVKECIHFCGSSDKVAEIYSLAMSSSVALKNLRVLEEVSQKRLPLARLLWQRGMVAF